MFMFICLVTNGIFASLSVRAWCRVCRHVCVSLQWDEEQVKKNHTPDAINLKVFYFVRWLFAFWCMYNRPTNMPENVNRCHQQQWWMKQWTPRVKSCDNKTNKVRRTYVRVMRVLARRTENVATTLLFAHFHSLFASTPAQHQWITSSSFLSVRMQSNKNKHQKNRSRRKIVAQQTCPLCALWLACAIFFRFVWHYSALTDHKKKTGRKVHKMLHDEDERWLRHIYRISLLPCTCQAYDDHAHVH